MRFSPRFLKWWFGISALVLLVFIIVIHRIERQAIRDELSERARWLGESLDQTLRRSPQSSELSELLTQFQRESEVSGILVCGASGETLAASRALPNSMSCPARPSEKAFEASVLSLHRESYLRSSQGTVLASRKPAYLILFQSFRDSSGRYRSLTRAYVLFVCLFIVLVASALVAWVYRRRNYRPLSRGLRALLTGNRTELVRIFRNPDFAPMVENLDQVLRALRRNRPATYDPNSPTWTPQRLRDHVQRLFGDKRLCVIANREPCIHNRKGNRVITVFPASGLVTAVEPAVRACSGLWIGHGSGTADRETADSRGVLLVPPKNPEYALKRVWLTKDEEEGYYYGFSNEGLWPLCHIAHTRPIFRQGDWAAYISANRKFARAFVEEMVEARPIALIQDYHFALLPAMIRESKPDAITSLFWHIPWPNPEAIGICPWKEELLKGMLGADLIGFHIQYHCNNFLDTVDRFLEARVDRQNFSVTIQGHTSFVRPFPISVEWPPRHDVPPDRIPDIRAQLLEELGLRQDLKIGLGVDRLDYTKGITERLLAVERMLELHPELIGKFVFIQIAAPSRSRISSYQLFEAEVRELATRINFRFHRPGEGEPPILLRIAHHDSEEVFRYYRAADVCLVTSLHDGMNLVAKEYIASRSDCRGMLVLSTFTGAASELLDALLVNPYDIEQTAMAIYRGLMMDDEERGSRMGRLRDTVARNNVYTWAGHFLSEVHRISEIRDTIRAVS